MLKKIIFSALILSFFHSVMPAGTAVSILIAADRSRVKDPVISKVIKDFKKEGYKVKTTAQTNMKGIPAEKYSAIIIVNSVSSRESSTGVQVFLSQADQRKVVLFNAVGNEYWHSSDSSTLSDINRIAERIEEKTKEVLAQ